MQEIIDSHFHLLEMKQKKLNVAQEIQNCKDQGIFAILDVGIDADDLLKRTSYYRQDFNLLFAAGIYPSAVEKANSIDEIDLLIKTLANQIKNSPIFPVALGEIGMDFYHRYGSPENQLYLFTRQIELANQLNLPIIIHNRDGDEEILQVLRETPASKQGVVHCFSSTPQIAYQFIDLGYKISFAGNVTYKKAVEIQRTATKIPLSTILIETDSPYLSPQAIRGKLNSPLNVRYIYEFIAQLRNIPMEDLIKQVKENFIALFHFPKIRC